MIRVIDLLCSALGIIFLSPIFFLLLVIGYFDTGSPIFSQKRMGLGQRPFNLLKFRSMKLETQSVPTHMVDVRLITRWGLFLRKSKLDELPQLINVFIGDMSFVGPRPNLFTQSELIRERELRKLYRFKPGITGLAQINRIDMSDPVALAEADLKMVTNFSSLQYLRFILLTLFGKGLGDNIKVE
jgi:lipopolysaccharide/colanic/teichoic acid biosynthesis glycosyltransferase